MPIICPNCNYTNRDGARFCATCRTPLTASLTPMPGMTGLLPSHTLLAGRYLILTKIGQGGMAAIYLVTDTRLAGKQWAVKEMSDAAITNPLEKQQAVSMFQREMQLLTQLQHRNIPQVVDTFTEGGKHFMVMEYVDGVTLEEVLSGQSDGSCAEVQVKAWFHQLADVLEYLHAQDPPIIFRDLKPENIMVDRSGTIKLIDFGIARVFSPHKAHDTQAFGTAGYAAPEQYGHGQTDARTDVYGLGATLYRLLTGYDPATTPMTLPPLEQFNVKISSPMRLAIQRALEHDPPQRWQSMREMADSMGIHVAVHQPRQSSTLPANAGAPGTFKVAPRPTTRLLLAVAQMSNWQLALLAGTLALLFAIGAAFLVPHISLEFATALPLYLLAGPLAYAASHRRGATAAAHIVVTGAVWLVASKWVRIESDLPWFVAGLLLSALVMELILAVRSALWPTPDPATSPPWWQDCAWLAGMTAIGGLVALGIPSLFGYYGWLRLWFPLTAAAVGALGWFLGDLYHQNVLLKQSGFSRDAFRSQ